jgi:hypothetical protein
MHTVTMRTTDMMPTTGITLPLNMDLKPGTEFALRFPDGRQGIMRVTGKPNGHRYPVRYADASSKFDGTKWDLERAGTSDVIVTAGPGAGRPATIGATLQLVD